MNNAYDPSAIEARWQRRWEAERTFRAPNPGQPGFDPAQPKYYVLDMFPYPSGAGLHVGHPVGYIGSDIVARRKRMEGYNVLHPMGYDAFGLPAEQHAVRTGEHPSKSTAANIERFTAQLKAIGLSYDWEREVRTCDPDYYRWTQWIFARLFDEGLAYQSDMAVWWCPELGTVLANEEVIDGRSEVGNYPCERRPMKQWMLRITRYAQRLLDDLELVDWPESVKTMQREWIGRSEGAEIDFPLADVPGEVLRVFTTRADTVFGATFMVVAPEHPLLERITSAEHAAEVKAYVEAAGQKTDLERTDLAKDKTGVFTGGYALNPLLPAGDPAARIPVYVADYVLISYGTGAIMAVPGHDERDFEFAQKYGIPVVEVVRPPEGQPGLDQGVCFTGDGTSVNSGPITGLATPDAKQKIAELLAERGAGEPKVTYRLRDWLFARQRYWGEPFPLLHHPDGSVTRVPDDHLPVLLPEIDEYKPAPDGRPPLARATDWVDTTDPVTGEPCQRETNTMPQWAGSCWYYLRFMDPRNEKAAWDPEVERYWGAVDLYIGGVEHAVLHLLYARFWHKVLFDLGLVSTPEPFQHLFNQGMLTAFAYKDPTGRLVPSDEVEEQDGRYVHTPSGQACEQVVAKMSKSLRNVVNPDAVIEQYGCDTFRLYEMFMGPLGESQPWNPRDVPGCRRFLDRVWRTIVDPEGDAPARPELMAQPAGEPAGEALELERALARALKQVDDSFEHFNFNTAIAGLMSFLNEVAKRPGALRRDQAERLVLALSPFAPHVAEELWERLGHADGISRAPWPQAEPRYLVEDEIELVVQVKGKRRAVVKVPREASEDELAERARVAVSGQLDGQQIVKTIVVPGRLVNFVTR